MDLQSSPAAPDGAADVEIWFDFASPYSYLALARIEALAARNSVQVRYQPFLLGPIFKARGWQDSPFRLFPDKGEYMMRDVARLAHKYGVPYRRPDTFPRMGLLASRIAAANLHQPWFKEYCLGVFRANFVDDLDLQDPRTLSAVLTPLGADSDALIEAGAQEPARLALRRQVEAAQARSVFGAPMLFTRGELFWGNDRLEDALQWACDGGPSRVPATAPATAPANAPAAGAAAETR